MKLITPPDLAEILRLHVLWLENDPDGKRADLAGADLAGADLTGATLAGADLIWATLTEANLTGANLIGATLTEANLTRADLTGANLTGATLTRTNLAEADLTRATLSPYSLCPVGAFHAFKQLADHLLCELLIAPDALRVSPIGGRKCRCSKAQVLRIYDGERQYGEGKSQYNASFKYTVGAIVEVDDFDPDIREECSRGIHFFITEEEAKIYE